VKSEGVCVSLQEEDGISSVLSLSDFKIIKCWEVNRR